MATADDHWVELARPFVEGRTVILGGGPLAGALGGVKLAHALGAARCLAIAGGLGVGELPSPDECDRVFVDVSAADLIAETRRWEGLCADPPPELTDAVERVDPDGTAVVWLPPFLTVQEICGRPVQGARRREWVALEDKTVIDACWDRWDVPHPPHQIVDVHDEAALEAAHRALDDGAGTVWSGDARDGFNGGAVFVHWVRTPDDATRACSHLAAHCDRVRVASFVEGVPCSIHGMVFDDHVATFRPVELLVLRSRTEGLLYAGVATYWDPPAVDRDAMRALARRVGHALREEVAFRGAFTIDGIMGAGGFVATELNPRFGAGLRPVGGSRHELLVVHRLLTAGYDLDYRPAAFERFAVEHADANRAGACYLPVAGDAAETSVHDLVLDGGWRLARDGEPRDALVELGPRASGPGAFVRVAREAASPLAAPFAVGAAEILAAVDEHLGLGLGPLSAATAVR